MNQALLSISPVDGRYATKTLRLQDYFSEFALMRYRLLVEVEYFIALVETGLPQLKGFDKARFGVMRKCYNDFSVTDAEHIKNTERVTNHDVKAVEYFLKNKLDESGLNAFSEFVHFGLTSQDINNTAVPLSFKDALENVYYLLLNNLISKLNGLAGEWKDVPMLARTHGQPASPTLLGKEISVFVVRLQRQLEQLLSIPFSAKFGGATGNFNAHFIAYPDIDWNHFANRFIAEQLGLQRSYPTTQIEHYDNLAAQFDALKRINTILIDFSRDVWQYIAMDYFKQKTKEGEIGSSAMPHKVNPIDFENAEGNLGIANALFEHLSAKLPVSRLQRDLTDSTVLRNIGVPVAHTVIAFESLLKGVDKLVLNNAALEKDLEANWAVVAEAIQTVLRREGFPKPYEALKKLTRGKTGISKASLHKFINGLVVSDTVKKELLQISPFTYTGRFEPTENGDAASSFDQSKEYPDIE